MAAFRLFIAINLPPELKEKLKELQDGLAARLSPKAMAWTRPEQCHLTLNFLGNVEEEKIPGLVASVRAGTGGFAPFQLTSAGVGVFPNVRQPRVLWAGVRSISEQLVTLHDATSNAVRELLPAEDKKFVGHITIGRAKAPGRADAQAIADFVRAHAGTLLGSWSCASIEIMRSELSSSGAIHTVYESISLGGGG